MGGKKHRRDHIMQLGPRMLLDARGGFVNRDRRRASAIFHLEKSGSDAMGAGSSRLTSRCGHGINARRHVDLWRGGASQEHDRDESALHHPGVRMIGPAAVTRS
jgi:hypothetical protein